jgi:ADP-ribose pyrophosphatase YjhB (NUDIX family)
MLRSTEQRSMAYQLLPHTLDTYGGVNIDPAQLPQDAAEFHARLQLSLAAWQQQRVKGVWLKLPLDLSDLVPVAVKSGFLFHSASAQSLVLCRWLPPSKSLLPPGPTAQVGVGAYILSSDHKLLLVQEACGPAAAAGMWKIPTGLMERGEDVAAAAAREVLEETGLRVSFVGVLGLLRRCRALRCSCSSRARQRFALKAAAGAGLLSGGLMTCSSPALAPWMPPPPTHLSCCRQRNSQAPSQTPRRRRQHAHVIRHAGAKWVSLDELQASGAPGSVSAAIAAPAVAWVRSRLCGDGAAQAAVMRSQELGKVPGASVFFSSCL